MGDFDDMIKWLKERRAEAVEDLGDYRSGRRRQFSNDKDVTHDLIARCERDIKKMDVYIAAYESHNDDAT